jgi:hypothetical protein
MSSQILFRSLKSSRNRVWDSGKNIRQHGSDWSHIRPYSDHDDIRDIAWNRIKPEWLSVRERENNGEFEIITYWWSTSYDEFYIRSPHESRKNAIKKAKDSIENSARFGQYPYRTYSGELWLKELIAMKPKNALIFICNLDVDLGLWSIAHHNDLIYIDIYHEFEMHPNSDLLFSWQVVDLDRYTKEYKNTKDSGKNIIKAMKGGYISLNTEEDFSTVLNTFFKKRYKNG